MRVVVTVKESKRPCADRPTPDAARASLGWVPVERCFTPGQPPEWDIERFMHGDEIDTAVITLERNRRTFAWKLADVGAEGCVVGSVRRR
jgi:hypothetical protein